MVDTTGPSYQPANFRGASMSTSGNSKTSKRSNKRSSSRGKRK